jgi:hypothetical protein
VKGSAPLFLALFVASVPALAQRPASMAAAQPADPRLACASSGSTVRVWNGVVDTAAGAERPTAGVNGQASGIDTTIVLAITDRSWQRDTVDAGVALGRAGTVRSLGEWNTCAGASVHLGRVTAQLHNVTGRIHLHADMSALDSIGRTRSGIPPAGPPRR